MTNLDKNPTPAGPAPSLSLLGEFAQRANNMRDEAAACKRNAAADAEAADVAQADADRLAEQLRAVLAEAERARKVFDDKQAEADEHRARAEQHAAKAAELIGDAGWMDEVNARAGRLPALLPQCTCNPLPGAPDGGERRAACPIHGTQVTRDEEPVP